MRMHPSFLCPLRRGGGHMQPAVPLERCHLMQPPQPEVAVATHATAALARLAGTKIEGGLTGHVG